MRPRTLQNVTAMDFQATLAAPAFAGSALEAVIAVRTWDGSTDEGTPRAGSRLSGNARRRRTAFGALDCGVSSMERSSCRASRFQTIGAGVDASAPKNRRSTPRMCCCRFDPRLVRTQGLPAAQVQRQVAARGFGVVAQVLDHFSCDGGIAGAAVEVAPGAVLLGDATIWPRESPVLRFVQVGPHVDARDSAARRAPAFPVGFDCEAAG
jgi:hypothetical protein